MRVLHLINSTTSGGAEILLLKSIEKFNELYPDDVHGVATLFEKGNLISRLPEGTEHFHIGITWMNFPLKIFSLNRYLKQNRIEILHSHLFESTIASRLALPRGVKLVSTYHSDMHNPASIEYSRKRLLADRITFRKKYFTVFVSSPVMRKIVKAVAMKKYEVVPNFPSSEFKPVYIFNSRRELKIVSVGGLKEIKNYPLAVAALSTLKEHDISLDIYGDGKERDALQKLISDSGVRIRLMGDAQISSSLLAEYDLFLMTSKSEGMPISLLEAIASGLPSLLNDIDMLRETAIDAALFFSNNSSGSLKEKLTEIYTNKNILRTLSDNAKKVSENYSVEKYVRKLHGIYELLLKS